MDGSFFRALLQFGSRPGMKAGEVVSETAAVTPAGATPEQLRAFLRGTPHPFALDSVTLLCVCGLDPLADVHDPVSLLDARAVLDGTGGPREVLVRELASRMFASAARNEAAGEAEAVTGQLADEAQDDDVIPPGVLGYAVGVFPGGGKCTGLTHTGLMTPGSARREAASGERAGYAHRVVEVREVSDGG